MWVGVGGRWVVHVHFHFLTRYTFFLCFWHTGRRFLGHMERRARIAEGVRAGDIMIVHLLNAGIFVWHSGIYIGLLGRSVYTRLAQCNLCIGISPLGWVLLTMGRGGVVGVQV